MANFWDDFQPPEAAKEPFWKSSPMHKPLSQLTPQQRAEREALYARREEKARATRAATRLRRAERMAANGGPSVSFSVRLRGQHADTLEVLSWLNGTSRALELDKLIKLGLERLRETDPELLERIKPEVLARQRQREDRGG